MKAMKVTTVKYKTVFADMILFLLVILFTYTAAGKFLDHDKFVYQMQLAPLPLMRLAAPFLGWFIPSIEALVAIGLLISRCRLIALYSSLGLLITFELYITGMLLSGHDLPCTCGGVIAHMTWQQHLVFNGTFIILILIAIKGQKHRIKSPAQPPAGTDPQHIYARNNR
jgi:putative oxidoreductase